MCLFCVGGRSEVSVGGSANREKVGTFSLSLLAVILNFYDFLATPNFIHL